MYKLLLCLRYLRTRWIALASIVSVTLGVMTMIVVNSVMAGFTTEMEKRLHGILSDLVLEPRDFAGEPDPDGYMEQINRIAGDSVEAMTPVVAVPAMISFNCGNRVINRQVQLVGIDETTQGQVSEFCRYLQHPKNREQMSFQLHEGGYDQRDHQGGPEAPQRPQMEIAGWERRRQVEEFNSFTKAFDHQAAQQRALPDPKVLAETDPFAKWQRREAPETQVDPSKRQYTGAVLGIAMANMRVADGTEHFYLLPGDDVTLTFPTAGNPPDITRSKFTVVDFYECKMSEYDSSFVFVPLRTLQEMRGMIEGASGVGRFTSIQIKLKPGADGNEVRDRIQQALDPNFLIVQVRTWQDSQGALLAAVHMETAILNVLLFLIIAVSGFGILAIFFMIVVEKTRDIGVLKSLGASGRGVMGIFVSYGLSLGVVGSGAGMVLGLLLVRYINELADLLGRLTGQPVFDPSIYYFYKIPTLVNPWTVAWIVLGAMGIAILASVLPALRAALLQPVEALRYE